MADCPVLDVASQGRDKEEAKKNLLEAIGLFLTGAYIDGGFDQVLKSYGFEVGSVSGTKEVTEGPCDEYLTVPLPFMITRETEECHV